MKKLRYHLMIVLLALPVLSTAQTYYSLPEENAYWTVLEFDWNTWQYNDVIYTVDGDTVINNLNYKVVYRLDDYPTIYDTISSLHCFMRQDVEEKKIWFIRHYLGESQEKLGYDLSIEVGDTVSLPAFCFSEFDDSLFYLQYIDSVNLEFIGELTGHRKKYFFSTTSMNGFSIDFIEGIIELRSTFPNLDYFFGFDAFHQSFSVCLQVNKSYWAATEPYAENCGFVVLDSEDYGIKSDLKIFPNPAMDLITVQLPDTLISPEMLTIYNSLGQLVMNKNIIGLTNNFVIDISNLVQGIYFLKINSNTASISTKMIVKP